HSFPTRRSSDLCNPWLKVLDVSKVIQDGDGAPAGAVGGAEGAGDVVGGGGAGLARRQAEAEVGGDRRGEGAAGAVAVDVAARVFEAQRASGVGIAVDHHRALVQVAAL